MPHIAEFLSGLGHSHISEYTLYYWLRDNNGCSICARIGRIFWTPDIEVDGHNIHQEVPHWMNLPIVNPCDKERFLFLLATWKYFEEYNISLEDLRKVFLDANNGKKEGAKIANKKDQGLSFDESKIRATARCKNWYASQCIYSDYKVRGDEGPSQERMKELEQ